MIAFDRLDAVAAALLLDDVDTDKIVPGRFLKTITRTGLGRALFWQARQDPAFVLNAAPWNAAGILIAGSNFGCGSSREHAPWALLDFGIRCIIARGIADIFYSNCFKNGILPITLAGTEIDRLAALAADPLMARMTIDLAAQTIASADGVSIGFTIDPRRKRDLIGGQDEIARALEHEAEIVAFEVKQRTNWPWLSGIRLDTLG